MSLTLEQIETIPVVYRDFLLALAPVIESRHEVVKISGVPFSHVYELVSNRHDYDLREVRELAHNLKAKGYVAEDHFGFLSPTALGEDVIRMLTPANEEPVHVPPLPDLG